MELQKEQERGIRVKVNRGKRENIAAMNEGGELAFK